MFAKRLERARRASGMSLRELGEKVGVSQTMVKKYEDGISMPSSGVLLKLAKSLHVRTEYFFRAQPRQLERVEFRKRSRLTKKSEEVIRGTILDQIERRLEVEDLFPSSPVESFDIEDRAPSTVGTPNAIEHCADRMRQAWGLGFDPIPDLADMLESHGIRVVFVDIAEPRFDGLAATVNGIPVIAVGKSWPGDRQRFTMAHELGHLLLKGRLRGIDEEAACNRFAGAFLFPARAVVQELGEKRHQIELRELAILKNEYRLSMIGILFRAKDLQIICDGVFGSMIRYFSRRGWRQREPGVQIASESTNVFERLVWRALAEDFIGDQKAAELLELSLSDFHKRRDLVEQHENRRK
jgi:Zn-dependent peptidase ImmA (M78 family)/transcriptional regulator with XRE-family HTH domain